MILEASIRHLMANLTLFEFVKLFLTLSYYTKTYENNSNIFRIPTKKHIHQFYALLLLCIPWFMLLLPLHTRWFTFIIQAQQHISRIIDGI